MTKKALILVDVQNDFCPGGSLAVNDGDKVVAPLNAMVEYALRNGWLIVASRDWHPAETKHFAAFGGRWPAHCVQDTHGAELHADLDRNKITDVFRKGADPTVDSYSGFFDNGKRNSTGLDKWLQERWIKRLYILGLATDYCVKFTALDACALGFDVWLVEDGCRAVELQPGDGERAIREMRGAGVTVVDSGSIGP